jgi:iron complex transport system ATP-binding protein
VSVLEVAGVGFRYGSDAPLALSDVSFSVEAGEHIALVGRNGSGKSTLFNLIAGFHKPSAGRIAIAGRGNLAPAQRARLVALVAQGERIRFPYTCLEVVLMGLCPYSGWFDAPDDTALRRAREVMEQAGAWRFAAARITELSGGETQRVLLARALLQALPTGAAGEGVGKVLLLDEALSELDIAGRISMMKTLDALAREAGVAVVGVHHDIELAGRFARRVIALCGGSVAADGAPEKVFTTDFFRDVFAVRAEIVPDKGFFFYDCVEEPRRDE